MILHDEWKMCYRVMFFTTCFALAACLIRGCAVNAFARDVSSGPLDGPVACTSIGGRSVSHASPSLIPLAADSYGCEFSATTPPGGCLPLPSPVGENDCPVQTLAGLRNQRTPPLDLISPAMTAAECETISTGKSFRFPSVDRSRGLNDL